MYAKFIKQERTDLNGTGTTQAFYKMELHRMGYRQFVDLCASEGYEQESKILGVLALVSEKLALCMAEGYSVKLDGIGTFHATLGVREDKLQDAFEPGETSRNAHTIKVKGVSFKADPELIKETSRKCVLKSGGVNRLHRSELTLEERIQKARKFLEENKFMHVGEYADMTGLSRTTASLELRKIDQDPSTGIKSKGIRSQKIYVLDD